MKKLAFLFITLMIVACSNETRNDDTVRELAKEDIIAEYNLPEGTKFDDEDIEITENKTGDAPLGYTYIVKITVKSQDREGNEVIKTHVREYKQIGEKGNSREDFELISSK